MAYATRTMTLRAISGRQAPVADVADATNKPDVTPPSNAKSRPTMAPQRSAHPTQSDAHAETALQCIDIFHRYLAFANAPSLTRQLDESDRSYLHRLTRYATHVSTARIDATRAAAKAHDAVLAAHAALIAGRARESAMALLLSAHGHEPRVNDPHLLTRLEEHPPRTGTKNKRVRYHVRTLVVNMPVGENSLLAPNAL